MPGHFVAGFNNYGQVYSLHSTDMCHSSPDRPPKIPIAVAHENIATGIVRSWRQVPNRDFQSVRFFCRVILWCGILPGSIPIVLRTSIPNRIFVKPTGHCSGSTVSKGVAYQYRTSVDFCGELLIRTTSSGRALIHPLLLDMQCVEHSVSCTAQKRTSRSSS